MRFDNLITNTISIWIILFIIFDISIAGCPSIGSLKYIFLFFWQRKPRFICYKIIVFSHFGYLIRDILHILFIFLFIINLRPWIWWKIRLIFLFYVVLIITFHLFQLFLLFFYLLVESCELVDRELSIFCNCIRD